MVSPGDAEAEVSADRAGFLVNLRNENDPYNTRHKKGLPPTPIGAPTYASLEAALRPAPVDYLYFVSRNDGSHAFASSLDDHNRNVQKFQVAYFRDRGRH